MKKNFLFLLVILLATGMTAGCSLFGDDDDAVATPAAVQRVNLAGAVPAAVVANAAPGRNLALNATSLLAVAVNVDTGLDIASANVLADRTFSIPVNLSAPVRTMVQIRHAATARTIMKRFVATLQVPTATRTISNVNVDETTTAQAIAVQAVINKGTANQTASEKAVLNTPVNPDVVTNLTVSDPATTQLNSFVAANVALQTVIANIRTQVQAVFATLPLVADPLTVLTTPITNPATLATATYNALVVADTVPAVKTAIDTAIGGTTVTIGTQTVTTGNTPTALTENDLTAITTAVTTQTAAVTVPTISTICVDNSTKCVYTATAGAATQAASYPWSPIIITFSEAVNLSNAKFKIRVTETITSTGVVTVKTVSHGYGTLLSGEINWMTAFGSAPVLSTSTSSFTVTPGGGSVRPGYTANGHVAATIRIDLLSFEGITRAGSSTVFLAPPTGTYGFYTIPAVSDPHQTL